MFSNGSAKLAIFDSLWALYGQNDPPPREPPPAAGFAALSLLIIISRFPKCGCFRHRCATPSHLSAREVCEFVCRIRDTTRALSPREARRQANGWRRVAERARCISTISFGAFFDQIYPRAHVLAALAPGGIDAAPRRRWIGAHSVECEAHGARVGNTAFGALLLP